MVICWRCNCNRTFGRSCRESHFVDGCFFLQQGQLVVPLSRQSIKFNRVYVCVCVCVCAGTRYSERKGGPVCIYSTCSLSHDLPAVYWTVRAVCAEEATSQFFLNQPYYYSRWSSGGRDTRSYFCPYKSDLAPITALCFWSWSQRNMHWWFRWVSIL